jgi:uncharacterized glyoxalase superfamily protein PhnB
MTDSHSVTSSVEVAVSPDVAFAVFTEELDCWWMQGPINFYDTARAYGKRMEPGVGGRIVEVYDPATRDGLELARITVWEPGERLAWRSSLDDVETEVTFDACEGGTAVSVRAIIPAGGSDRGGTAWVRMTPPWFAGWIARRDRVAHRPFELARLAVGVHYAEPARAARWLRDVFGFEPSGNVPDDDVDEGDHTWIEFHVGNCAVMVFKRDGDPGAVTHTPWVFVDDVDAHFARTREAGAKLLGDIWEHGARAYDVADLEGNRWTFVQASPVQRGAGAGDAGGASAA